MQQAGWRPGVRVSCALVKLMPAYNFQSRFEHAVATGRKRQTIRQWRKDGRIPKPGQTAHLFVLMRTKACRRIGRAPIVSVDEVRLMAHRGGWLAIKVNGRVLSREIVQAFVRADGFANEQEMRVFFAKTYGLPFDGLLIAWGDFEA